MVARSSSEYVTLVELFSGAKDDSSDIPLYPNELFLNKRSIFAPLQFWRIHIMYQTQIQKNESSITDKEATKL